MRPGVALAVTLLVAACGHRAPKPVDPAALEGVTIRCPKAYTLDLAEARIGSGEPLPGNGITLHGGRAEPEPDASLVLLDGLGGTADLDGDDEPETVIVLNWAPAGGNASITHLLVLRPDDDGPECVADVALQDRERPARVNVVDGAVRLDVFTHGPGEPMAVATQRVVGVLHVDGDPPVPHATAAVARPRLGATLDEVRGALRPDVDLPDPDPARTTVQASAAAGGIDVQVHVDGARVGAVQLVLALPLTPPAVGTLERLLSRLDDACSAPLSSCLQQQVGAPPVREVTYGWCECGGLAVASWHRAGLAVVTVVPRLGASVVDMPAAPPGG